MKRKVLLRKKDIPAATFDQGPWRYSPLHLAWVAKDSTHPYYLLLTKENISTFSFEGFIACNDTIIKLEL